MARIASHLMPKSLAISLYSAFAAAGAELAKEHGLTFTPGDKPEPKNGHVVLGGFTFAKTAPAAETSAPVAVPPRRKRKSPMTLNPFQIDNGPVATLDSHKAEIKAFRKAFTMDNFRAHGKCGAMTAGIVKAFGNAPKGLDMGEGYRLVGFDKSRREKPFVVASKHDSLWFASAEWVAAQYAEGKGK